MTSKCTLPIGSVTYAQKAMRILTSRTIYSEIVKLDQNVSKTGCIYGLELSCSMLEDARAALKSAGMKLKTYGSGDGKRTL